MERYVCVHGHFYQPPRENPWLEYVEAQDAAHPYHDWNEKITAECYAPNSASRILDEHGRIARIVNNYSRMSFDFGPTLLAWMESQAPGVYQAVLEAEKESQHTFSGHSSALAQPYNHMILPLASSRDKRTQVLWGIRDFQHRFGHNPEGMWLPETAVDLETLEIMAAAGIRFTILAPHQALRIRPIGKSDWREVARGRIDTTMAYTLRLPSDRSIALFFYDEAIARAVAFGGLLSSGEAFARWLVGGFSEGRTEPQLVHIATDGETYGHHHRFGDMALAYALHKLEGMAHITNYGEYLERHPPTHEVESAENTSWSCAHGVERWRRDCGCNFGQQPGWSQAWRAPLRQALDWLRDTLIPRYEEKAGQLLKDPWAARDDYIEVVLDRSRDRVERFLTKHTTRPLDQGEEIAVLKLLELQRHAMLMYTSCGWFFDDLAGIETVQVLRYAGRAARLAKELFGEEVETTLLQILQEAKSNLPEQGDGCHIYERLVKPTVVDLARVAAYYAVRTIVEEHPKETRLYCYTIRSEDYQRLEAGRARLAIGRARVTSTITGESSPFAFGVLYLGDRNLHAGVHEYRGEPAYQAMVQETSQAFMAADFPQVISSLDKHFSGATCSFSSLLRDEQRRVLRTVLEPALAEIEGDCRHIYETHHPLMRSLAELGQPLPVTFRSAVGVVLNAELRKALVSQPPDVERLAGLLEEVKQWDVPLDAEGLGYLYTQALEGMMSRFVASPGEEPLLERLVRAVTLARSMPFDVDLWKVQNLYYEMTLTAYPRFQQRAEQKDTTASEWVRNFVVLGEKLSMGVP